MRNTVLALIVVALAAVATAHPTPDRLWTFQGIEDINAFATLPDVDGDGVADIVCETYDAGASGDHLYLLSGASVDVAQVIWSARPSSGASDGGGDGQECLVTCDDLSGDGFPDVLLGTAWGNRSVHALDGRTGDVLWTFDTYDEPDSGWIYSVRAHPDRTGDGRPEVIFGAGSECDRGYMLDGATGTVLWRFIGSGDAIGHVVSLDDADGDQVGDVLFCGWDYEDRVFCVSGGASGVTSTIWSYDSGNTNYHAISSDDLDGDGTREVVVGLWAGSGQVRCLDGADGSVVWIGQAGSNNYVMRLALVGDADGDGARDIAVGSWDNGLRVLSGRTGELLWVSYAGTTNGGDFWTVDRAPDVDGDGIDEVVGGSFDRSVYLFSGADGDTLWTFPTTDRLFAVAGGPDLSGNGLADILGGTQDLGSGGRAHALEGGDDITAVPDLPQAAGQAVVAGGGVDLTWTVNSPWPCVVDRLEDVGTKSAAHRQALARAHERGEMTVREVLAAIRDEGKSAGAVRLTELPLQPENAEAGGWRYALHDDDSPREGTVYRVSGISPEGREVALLEMTAGTPPAVLAARLAPNPFNPRTDVRLSLSRAGSVTVDVYDAAGRRLARLGPVTLPAGDQSLTWDGTGFDGRALPSGTYLLRVSSDSATWTLRGALVR